MSEDETDPDEGIVSVKSPVREEAPNRHVIPLQQPILTQLNTTSPSTERATTTEGSFHSAREAPIESEDVIAASGQSVGPVRMQEQDFSQQNGALQGAAGSATEDAMVLDHHDDDLPLDEPIDASNSTSQGSSPFEPLVRKSSLTFAALPAPEPWTNKKSLGARISRTSQLDQAKNPLSRSSYLGRITGGKSLGASKQLEENQGNTNLQDDEMDLDETSKPILVREESDGDAKMARLHNKSSTQRLHERINMLGKSQPARPTKSIPAAAVGSNPAYPDLPSVELQARAPEQTLPSLPKSTAISTPEEDEDDWIQPPTQAATKPRPQLPKSTTADVMENIRGKQHIGGGDFEPGLYDGAAFADPSNSNTETAKSNLTTQILARSASAKVLGSPQKDLSTTYAQLSTIEQETDRAEQQTSTMTPSATPNTKRNVDGPISASKSKLQSIMKTARGLFTSSAGVSAQAKIEALSSPTTRSRGKAQEIVAIGGSKGNNEATVQANNVNPGTPKQPEGRKTRSSTEKEEKMKQQEARVRELEQAQTSAASSTANTNPKLDAQPKPSQPAKPTRQSPRRLQKQPDSNHTALESEGHLINASKLTSEPPMPPPHAQTTQLHKQKESRRPVRPPKEAPSKPRPQTIRVGAPSQQPRPPLPNSSISSFLHESLPSAQSSKPGLGKKASDASIHTTASTKSLKGGKPKALIAAEKKKEEVCISRSKNHPQYNLTSEQDEKEAQRKLDHKKDIERKRAALLEEKREQERLEREEAERQRERERSATVEDPKKAASRQLIEKRRLELAKKDQQQRMPQRANQEAVSPFLGVIAALLIVILQAPAA